MNLFAVALHVLNNCRSDHATYTQFRVVSYLVEGFDSIKVSVMLNKANDGRLERKALIIKIMV